MTTADMQDRPFVFLAVLLSHVLVVLLAIRTSRIPMSMPENAYEPLLVMDLQDRVSPIVDSVKPSSPTSSAHIARRKVPVGALPSQPEVPPQSEPLRPSIDWEHEAELAAQKEIARTEKEKAYRDLSALSAAQRNWIKQNHMEPAPPGIQWKHPRVEIRDGFPIIWINDRCVFIPWMMFAVFCGIGHIEPNGDLFKHMRDPHDP